MREALVVALVEAVVGAFFDDSPGVLGGSALGDGRGFGCGHPPSLAGLPRLAQPTGALPYGRPMENIRYGRHVRDALSDHRPVVALESTIIAHGLPRPRNLEVAREIEQTVRDHGAVPATVGMVAGELVVGLDSRGAESARDRGQGGKAFGTGPGPSGRGRCRRSHHGREHCRAGRARGHPVFATGGLGGVHRAGPVGDAMGAAALSYDESADLVTLSHTPIAVICAGVKSVLDVGATLERLETLGVTVVGYRTRRFPGFYLSDSGFDLDWSVDSPEELASVLYATPRSWRPPRCHRRRQPDRRA